MTDPVLEARVAALLENLERVGCSHQWFHENLLPFAEADDQLWGAVDMTINLQVRNQCDALNGVRDKLQKAPGNDPGARREAWSSYMRIYDESQDIFRECLELVGGLAFRGMKLDEQIWRVAICQIADELIRSCALQSIAVPWNSLTVPAPEEALKQTLARIIRLRFPEWTIWTLPFTAHEYGHVVAHEREDLHRLVREEAGRVVAQGAVGGDVAARALRADYHAHEFFADAFATYTMGPAYACAAIRLRFDPLTAYEDGAEHPGYAKRAAIVFGILRRMDEEAGMPAPYSDVRTMLEKDWGDMLACANPSIAAPNLADLDVLANTFWGGFKKVLRSTAQYPARGEEEGWAVAQQWEQVWRQRLQTPPLPELDLKPTSKLRDVLNAAWLCRLDGGASSVTLIADAAHHQCGRIIEQRRQPRGPGNPPRPRRPPRG